MNKRYLFLIYSTDEDTGVWSKEDLYPQFVEHNKNVYVVEIFAPSEKIAWALGHQKAFLANYQNANSVCNLVEIDWSDKTDGYHQHSIGGFDREY